jgi:hypothetical protein
MRLRSRSARSHEDQHEHDRNRDLERAGGRRVDVVLRGILPGDAVRGRAGAHCDLLQGGAGLGYLAGGGGAADGACAEHGVLFALELLDRLGSATVPSTTSPTHPTTIRHRKRMTNRPNRKNSACAAVRSRGAELTSAPLASRRIRDMCSSRCSL